MTRDPLNDRRKCDWPRMPKHPRKCPRRRCRIATAAKSRGSSREDGTLTFRRLLRNPRGDIGSSISSREEDYAQVTDGCGRSKTKIACFEDEIQCMVLHLRRPRTRSCRASANRSSCRSESLQRFWTMTRYRVFVLWPILSHYTPAGCRRICSGACGATLPRREREKEHTEFITRTDDICVGGACT